MIPPQIPASRSQCCHIPNWTHTVMTEGLRTNCGDIMSCSCESLQSKTIRSNCSEQSCSCGVYMIKCSADLLLCSQADKNIPQKKYDHHHLNVHIRSIFENTLKQNLPLNQHFKAPLQDKKQEHFNRSDKRALSWSVKGLRVRVPEGGLNSTHCMGIAQSRKLASPPEQLEA